MGNLGFWLEKLILTRFVQERNKKLALHRMSMSNLLKIFCWRWIHLKVHTSVYSVEFSYFLFHDTICNFADLIFFHFARQNALVRKILRHCVPLFAKCGKICEVSENKGQYALPQTNELFSQTKQISWIKQMRWNENRIKILSHSCRNKT